MSQSKLGLFVAPVLILSITGILYRKRAISRGAALVILCVTTAISAVLISM